MRVKTVPVIAAAFLVFGLASFRAADTLPAQLSDGEYWKLISDFSEPDGHYPYTVITSNEIAYQEVLPQLTKAIAPGGTYLGVGPEQNFTYIAALRPRIAFIIDIRREMLLEHLLYKAVFEMSEDRAEFVSKLFSRARPGQLTSESSVDAIFRAYAAVPGSPELAETRLKDILARLKTTHGFALSAADENIVRSLHTTFLREGVVRFNSSIESPGYTALMLATEGTGRNWSYLASAENYARVRSMQQKNLIIPLVGDFGGPKALRMTGQYLRDHGATVNVFYLSNVEDYIDPVFDGYARNVASLPIDKTSLFIHTSLQVNSLRPWLVPIAEFARPRGILQNIR
jgi:hypothetical protein